VDDFGVERLNAGWYVDWRAHLNPPHPAGLDHMQIVWTYRDAYSPDAKTLADIAANNPGAVWIVGNEPDCKRQGNSTPDQYARIYHEVYTTLKASDPSCRVTIGGLVQATPLRLQWLDAVRDTYWARYGQPFPADLWNIHAHIMREELGSWGCEIPPGIDATAGMLWEVEDHDSPELFAGQIELFRQWMADHGERDKELIVSEYGVLMPERLGFDADRVRAYMLSTFDYLMTATDPELGHPADGNRLVQRWAWYSLNVRHSTDFAWSYLFDPRTGQVTHLGLAFEDYVVPLHAPYVDLLPAALHFSPTLPLASAPMSMDVEGDASLASGPTPVGGPMPMGGQAVTITLTALIRNGGNRDVEDVTAWFWADTVAIGGVQVIPVLGARSISTISVEWQNVTVGPHTVGVTVDAKSAIAEANEDNNVLTRRLLVAMNQVYLPICLYER
jgi:hypothetical protein